MPPKKGKQPNPATASLNKILSSASAAAPSSSSSSPPREYYNVNGQRMWLVERKKGGVKVFEDDTKQVINRWDKDTLSRNRLSDDDGGGGSGSPSPPSSPPPPPPPSSSLPSSSSSSSSSSSLSSLVSPPSSTPPPRSSSSALSSLLSSASPPPDTNSLDRSPTIPYPQFQAYVQASPPPPPPSSIPFNRGPTVVDPVKLAASYSPPPPPSLSSSSFPLESVSSSSSSKDDNGKGEVKSAKKVSIRPSRWKATGGELPPESKTNSQSSSTIGVDVMKSKRPKRPREEIKDKPVVTDPRDDIDRDTILRSMVSASVNFQLESNMRKIRETFRAINTEPLDDPSFGNPPMITASQKPGEWEFAYAEYLSNAIARFVGIVYNDSVEVHNLKQQLNASKTSVDSQIKELRDQLEQSEAQLKAAGSPSAELLQDIKDLSDLVRSDGDPVLTRPWHSSNAALLYTEIKSLKEKEKKTANIIKSNKDKIEELVAANITMKTESDQYKKIAEEANGAVLDMKVKNSELTSKLNDAAKKFKEFKEETEERVKTIVDFSDLTRPKTPHMSLDKNGVQVYDPPVVYTEPDPNIDERVTYVDLVGLRMAGTSRVVYRIIDPADSAIALAVIRLKAGEIYTPPDETVPMAYKGYGPNGYLVARPLPTKDSRYTSFLPVSPPEVPAYVLDLHTLDRTETRPYPLLQALVPPPPNTPGASSVPLGVSHTIPYPVLAASLASSSSSSSPSFSSPSDNSKPIKTQFDRREYILPSSSQLAHLQFGPAVEPRMISIKNLRGMLWSRNTKEDVEVQTAMTQLYPGINTMNTHTKEGKSIRILLPGTVAMMLSNRRIETERMDDSINNRALKDYLKSAFLSMDYVMGLWLLIDSLQNTIKAKSVDTEKKAAVDENDEEAMKKSIKRLLQYRLEVDELKVKLEAAQKTIESLKKPASDGDDSKLREQITGLTKDLTNAAEEIKNLQGSITQYKIEESKQKAEIAELKMTNLTLQTQQQQQQQQQQVPQQPAFSFLPSPSVASTWDDTPMPQVAEVLKPEPSQPISFKDTLDKANKNKKKPSKNNKKPTPPKGDPGSPPSKPVVPIEEHIPMNEVLLWFLDNHVYGGSIDVCIWFFAATDDPVWGSAINAYISKHLPGPAMSGIQTHRYVELRDTWSSMILTLFEAKDLVSIDDDVSKAMIHLSGFMHVVAYMLLAWRTDLKFNIKSIRNKSPNVANIAVTFGDLLLQSSAIYSKKCVASGPGSGEIGSLNWWTESDSSFVVRAGMLQSTLQANLERDVCGILSNSKSCMESLSRVITQRNGHSHIHVNSTNVARILLP
jgi:hypothetical protein